MPISLEHTPPEGGTLCIWHIIETEGRLASQCTETESRAAMFFASSHRRREYLAWRGIAHRLAPHASIGYDATGGPVFNHSTLHLGVSHTRDYAAVIVAPRPCTVDIEDCKRNFATATPRYMTTQEESLAQQLLPADTSLSDGLSLNRFPALLWCAKEAAYKWAREEGVDFLKDIRLQELSPATASLLLTIRNRPLELRYLFHKEICCVYGIRE